MFKSLIEKITKIILGKIEEFQECIENHNKEAKEELISILKKQENDIGVLSSAFEKSRIEFDQKLIKNYQEYNDKLDMLEKNFDNVKNDIKSCVSSNITVLRDYLGEKIIDMGEASKNKLEDFDLQSQRLEIKLDKKLIEQHQEYSDKLFEILSSFLRWNKEISLVSYLGGKEPDLKKLKQELERPMIEAEWAKTNSLEAEKINQALSSKGEKIRQAREKYKDEKLALEREHKDASLVNAKLEILNILMEGAE